METPEREWQPDELGHLEGREVKCVKLKRPKHPEMYSSKECAAFRPWRVVLQVRMTEDDVDPVPYEVYLRAKSVKEAQWTAVAVFNILEKIQQGLPADAMYPDIAETGTTSEESIAELLTEEEYMERWREAQYYPHVKGGMQENPTVFRFVRTGNSVNEFERRNERKIISTPSGMSAKEAADVAAKMNTIDMNLLKRR